MGVSSYKDKDFRNKDIKSDENNKYINVINLRHAVKSPYIIKKMFSILCENRKLNMIIYNKNLQNLFEITIEDYKRKSIGYIEGERNGKGKEYYKNGE